MKTILFKMNKYLVIVVGSCFMVATANIAFFQQLAVVYPLATNFGFFSSLAIIHVAFLILILSLLSLIIPARALVAFSLILASTTAYFADQFGTVIDINMIRSAMQTNSGETQDLLSMQLFLRLFFLGFLPALFVLFFPYRRKTWIIELKHTFLMGGAALGVMLASIFLFSQQYRVFLKEHKPIRLYSNPIYPIYSGIRYAKSLILKQDSKILKPLETNVMMKPSDGPRKLVILVVGETARADHFQLNGYARDTNPILSKESNLISYTHVSACGTLTAISLPCMFSYAGYETFSIDNYHNTENVLDLLKRAGVNLLWRDNNSDSTHVAKRIPYEDFRSPSINADCTNECRDTGMLAGLQEIIHNQSQDMLIVLHQMGSHGPGYYRRYPKSFEIFTPVCRSVEFSECSDEEIINAYDNSIVYTDYFLSKVIELLKENSENSATAMIYVSDHGESLGELGLYLHGMRRKYAPQSQLNIPLLVWSGTSSNIDYLKSLSQKDKTLSHDALFDTLLEVFEIETNLEAVSSEPLIYLKENDDLSEHESVLINKENSQD